MNKVLLLGGAVLFAALLFGCIGGEPNQGPGIGTPAGGGGMQVQQAAPQKCVIMDKESGYQYTYYFDGKGNMRMEATMEGEHVVMITKDNMVYQAVSGDDSQCDWMSIEMGTQGGTLGITGYDDINNIEMVQPQLSVDCTNIPLDESMFTPSGKICSMEDMFGAYQ